MKKHKQSMYFFVIAFGIFLHIFLDFLLGGGAYEGIMWLYPLSQTAFKIHLIHLFGLSDLPATLDAVLLIGWLWHEEVKHKTSDFI